MCKDFELPVQSVILESFELKMTYDKSKAPERSGHTDGKWFTSVDSRIIDADPSALKRIGNYAEKHKVCYFWICDIKESVFPKTAEEKQVLKDNLNELDKMWGSV